MSFLHPILAGAGLACVAVPILIHILMRRRRRPIAWGAMRFLLEAYRRQRRRLALEQILLLVVRCLIVALAALAIGRLAFSPAESPTGPRTVYLLIDNALASSAIGDDGAPALDRHLARARQVLDALDPDRGDRAALITLARPADPLVVPPSGDLGAVARALDAITATDSRTDLAGGLDAVAALQTGELDPQAQILILSDWLAGSAPTEAPLPDLGDLDRLDLLASPPAPAGQTNIAIESIEPDRAVVLASGAPSSATPDDHNQRPPGGTSQVRVALVRSGPGVGLAQTRRVRLLLRHLDGLVPLGEAVVRFDPGQTRSVAAIPVELGAIARGDGVLVARADPDAIAGDDERGRTLQVRSALRVGVVAPPGPDRRTSIDRFTPADWIELALVPQPDRAGEIVASRIAPSSVDQTRLARLDAVFVANPGQVNDAAWADLARFARRGGVVVVSPDPHHGAQLWTDPFTEAFGLDWTIGREGVEVGGVEGASIEASDHRDGSILALLLGELQGLVRPVRITRALPITVDPSARIELALDSDQPMIVSSPPMRQGVAPGRGLVVLIACSLDLDWTTLPAKPLMVPMLQELVRQGVGEALGSWAFRAGQPVATPAGTAELHALDPRPDQHQPPGVIGTDDEGLARAPIRRRGIYRAIDPAGATRGLVVVNADPRAGQGDRTADDELRRWLASTGLTPRWTAHDETTDPAKAPGDGAAARRDDPGRVPLALTLFLIAAGLAGVELALARQASHATIQTDPSSGRIGPGAAP